MPFCPDLIKAPQNSIIGGAILWVLKGAPNSRGIRFGSFVQVPDIIAYTLEWFGIDWNQYLWPLLITTDKDMFTIVMSIKQMLEAVEEAPNWRLIMMTALLSMLPPIAVVVAMQKLFVKGLAETEK